MSYPKMLWVLTRAEVILEDDKEVINHHSDEMIGGTFSSDVAEKMAAVLAENSGPLTMIKSSIKPLPSIILDITEPVDISVSSIFNMVDV